MYPWALAPPPPKTITREWEEASNQRALEQKSNPITGLSLRLDMCFHRANILLAVQAYHRKGTLERVTWCRNKCTLGLLFCCLCAHYGHCSVCLL